MQHTTPRANRIPRIPAPTPSTYRRLLTGLAAVRNTLKRWYLLWLLYRLGQQLDKVEAKLKQGADTAAGAARVYRFSRKLNARRRQLRRQQAQLTGRMLAVRRLIDSLEVQR